MKFAYPMLLDFVRTTLTAEEAGDLLTMAGFELEGIEEVEGDPVLDVKVMSNRGDGLSMLGLAREVLAKDENAKPTDLYMEASKRFAHADSGEYANPARVSIETSECSRYACRYWQEAPNGASPEWMQKRLRQAGMRPISLLVDLSNYVMLELGQPLHAFDYDKLSEGRIVVREARDGEELKTLDGVNHELNSRQMMICDASGPVGAAGIMGGEASEVTSDTRRVLLEAAHFKSNSVRRTRKELGLNTEASYRFERSVDPDGVVAAIRRFSDLLGQTGSEIVDEYPGRAERQPLSLRIDRARMLLGMEIGDDEAKRHLERLGMEVMGHGDPYFVIPPSWRPDIVLEEDLIEELGRVHGYERIPERLPKGETTFGGSSGEYQEVDRIREAAMRAGFIQMMSHTLRDKHPLDGAEERIGPRNPGSPEMAWLRNSLWPSLAEAAARNGGRDLHLFEMGRVFRASGSGAKEQRSLAFLSTGELIPADRKGESVPSSSFFSLKGSLEELFAQAGRKLQVAECAKADGRLHPTRQAILRDADGHSVGLLGQIHPDVADESRLPVDTVLAEIWLDKLLDGKREPIRVKEISRNPAVRRDIALLIDKSVPFRSIDSAILASGGEVLEKHWLFDVFAGAGIPEGKHSLGIALQLRKFGENFTDEEANDVRERVVTALTALGGTTR
jgi:phenylalanyl-tRNA synthetase beta chain